MAKAQFNRNQRVWVECVGAWSLIERIIPVWSKGFDEPIRILYDVGLGREFTAQELRAEGADVEPGELGESWRILRARNKWQSSADCAHHPHPGTFPVVVTDVNDWGGWRTPGAEYDRDPERIERQARLIAAAPRLRALVEDIVTLVGDGLEEAPQEVQELGLRAERLLSELQQARSPVSAGAAGGGRTSQPPRPQLHSA